MYLRGGERRLLRPLWCQPPVWSAGTRTPDDGLKGKTRCEGELYLWALGAPLPPLTRLLH